jgi:hypothetical protein
VLRREALGGQLRQEVDGDDRLARSRTTADQKGRLLRGPLPIADAPHDVVERDLLLVEEDEGRLPADDSGGVL